jgi:hypothetical protein
MKGVIKNIILFLHILRNMGLEYVLYKSWHIFSLKSGLMKIKFPEKPRTYYATNNSQTGKEVNSINTWKETDNSNFYKVKKYIDLQGIKNVALKEAGERILGGEILFFSHSWIKLGKDYDWITNPKTAYRYDITMHWSRINELDHVAGDIKFVWEKSRFSYLLTIIRYDYQYNLDCSQFVLEEILSWIEKNPVNRGPNWICSQEISIRLLNWFFAINYYKNSHNFSEEYFQTILQSIYDQVHHVYSNINFSRKTVKNNHALTETLMIYMAGYLFPFFRKASRWQKNGKKWFEKEILYQIYEDGSYIQYSMNYHRVAVQLLTLGIFFSEHIDDAFSPAIYERAEKSLSFLYQILNQEHGFLPNYGNDDGSLFFPLNGKSYNDYRPQLNALYYAIHKKHLYPEREIQEDVFWLGSCSIETSGLLKRSNIRGYDSGGYYVFRDNSALTFIRCGKHKDRPGQADNLHVDISLNGINLFRDAGSYQYNADPESVGYFFGSGSHNTVVLGNSDQMKRSGRFIWLHWSQSIHAEHTENEEWMIFEGTISAFRHVKRSIKHNRKVRKRKGLNYWEIEDKILNKPKDLNMVQVWHPHPDFMNQINISASDESNNPITLEINEGWHAPGYGIKDKVPEIQFSTKDHYIKTIIKII